MGGRFTQGVRPRETIDEAAGWEEMWALERALSVRGEAPKDTSALARTGNAATVLFPNYGAGRSAAFRMPAGGIKDLEASISRAAFCLQIRGGRNGVVSAPSRIILRARGRDLYPNRQLREKFRRMVGGGMWSRGRGYDGVGFRRHFAVGSLPFAVKQCLRGLATWREDVAVSSAGYNWIGFRSPSQ